MAIEPMSKQEIEDLVQKSEKHLGLDEGRLWRLIRIPPRRWSESECGNETNGFWAVGLFGSQVVWYNEIEDGFNLSAYESYGHIEDYSCNQDELHFVIRRLIHFVLGKTSNPAGSHNLDGPQSL